jgi:two-component system chemotaxis sensor kinase CheA
MGQSNAAARPLKSVGIKLAGATLAILSVVATIAFLYVSRAERERALHARESTAVTVASLFAQSVQAPVAFADSTGVAEEVERFVYAPTVIEASVVGIDPSGAHVELGRKSRESLEPGLDLAPEHVGVQRGREQILVQTPIVSPTGRVLGLARVAFSLAEDNRLIARTERSALVGTMLVGLGLAAALIALTRSLIVRRLAALANAVRALQRGEPATVDVNGEDEIASLADVFRSMSSAIEAREREISRRNSDLRRVLDNVDAGFLTVDRDGKMSDERSKVLESWFGEPESSDFFAYVGQFSRVAAHALRNGWRDIAEDFMPLEVILDQLPSRLDLRERSFALGYSPVLEGDVVTSLVVSITDVTAQVQHEASQRAQRQALAVYRILIEDRSGFENFLKEGDRLISGLRARTAGRDVVLRNLHTLKGNAAIYELETIASICHELEDQLAEELGTCDSSRLVEAWFDLLLVVSDLGGGQRERIEMSRDEYQGLVDAISRGAAHADLVRRVEAFSNEPGRIALGRAAQQTRAIARRLGKTAVRVEITAPPDLRLDAEIWQPIWLAVPHVLRNALDHGIEGGVERARLGKAREGRITLSLVASDGATTLRIQDDGAGIDWAGVRRAAEQRGLPVATATDLEAAIFEDRVSSRQTVTETSGRGVGMSAVREVVEAAGGRVTVASERGVGTTFSLELPTARRAVEIADAA